MQKTIINKQINQLTFIFISLILLSSFKTSDPIVLLDKPIPLKPKEFYIAGVTDERPDKNMIAELVIKDPTNKTIIQAADLQGGPSVAISRFIERNLPKDPSLRPVIVSIKELNLKETAVNDGRIDGRIKLHLSFGLQKDYGVDHLLDYSGGLHYIRSNNNITSIEGHLRNILKTSLIYFDGWMKDNASFNRKLAKDVKINFTDYTEKPEGDTIYYSASRPLTWDDFQSHIKPSSRFEAEVMPGIGYNQQAEVIKGIINVNIAMKAYVPKSACRANDNGRDEYALNHEQRHFDIVKIITEQFKQKVLAEKLTADTYEAFINIQYLDSYRDMDAMQKAYDKETNHGNNKLVQAAWNERIDKELKIMPSS